MSQPALKFYDRVVNRKLVSQVLVGTVTGILLARHFKGLKSWTELYPDWEKGYVVYVTLDQEHEGKTDLVFPLDDLVLMDEACNCEDIEPASPV